MNRHYRPSTHLIVGALVIVVAVGLWLASRQAELRATEIRIAEIVASNHRAVAAFRQRQIEGIAPVGQSSAASTGDPKASTDPALVGNFAKGDRIQTRLRTMSEYAPHERRELRRRTMRMYRDLFAQMNLPADRLEALKLILDENNGTIDDTFRAAYAQGYGQTSPQFQQLMKRYYDEGEERVREFLSAEEYNRYADYNKSATWRSSQLPELESYLSLHGSPVLTNEQKAALAAAYLETQNWQPTGSKPPAGTLFRLRNEQLAEKVGGRLAPEQQAALVAYLRYANELSQLLGRLLHPQDPDAFAISMSSQ